MDDIFPLPDGTPLGDYLMLFDPLDGSSNIDVNVSVEIYFFSILKKAFRSTKRDCYRRFLQAGSQQVCAGYVIIPSRY